MYYLLNLNTEKTLTSTIYIYFYLLIWEEMGQRHRDRCVVLFHLFMYSLVDSCMCPDWGSNPQPWSMETMLLPTERLQPGQPYTVLKIICSLYSGTERRWERAARLWFAACYLWGRQQFWSSSFMGIILLVRLFFCSFPLGSRTC